MRQFALFLLIGFMLSVQPVQQPPALFEDLGVVWADNGNTLKVLFREYDEYFVRLWDFSGNVEEIDDMPTDEPVGSFSKAAYAVGLEAMIVDGEIHVYITRLGEGKTLLRTVYGHAV